MYPEAFCIFILNLLGVADLMEESTANFNKVHQNWEDITPGIFRIQRLQGATQICDRLRELGLIEGVQVQVLSRLPLGGPWRVQVGSAQFALRPLELRCLVLGACT